MKHVHFVTLQTELFLIWVSIWLMLPFLQTGIALANPETVVKVDPQVVSADVGETFIVNVTVVDVQNLYGVEVDFYWNASVLQLVNVDIRVGVESHSDGVLHEPFFNLTLENEGEYVLAATSTSPDAPSFNGSGNVIRVTFRVVSLGESELDLETQLYDYPPLDREPPISMPIEHTTIDGFFSTVIPEIINTTILILVLILATLSVAGYKTVLKKTSRDVQFSFSRFQPTFISAEKLVGMRVMG